MDMAVELTAEEMVEAIRERKGGRSNRELAEETGVSEQYICDILHGRRLVSDTVANKFGFQRLLKYRKAPVAQRHRATHS